MKVYTLFGVRDFTLTLVLATQRIVLSGRCVLLRLGQLESKKRHHRIVGLGALFKSSLEIVLNRGNPDGLECLERDSHACFATFCAREQASL